FVPGGSAGERSGGARKISCGVARSNSGRAAPSACVGKLFGYQIDRNRSTRRAGERGGARVGRPRWLRILRITGGSSMAAGNLLVAARAAASRRVDSTGRGALTGR